MAAKRPASDSAEVTPTEVGPGEVTPVAVAVDPTPAAPDSVPAIVVAEPVAVETPSVPAPAAAQPAAAGQQVVYVEAPKPFIAKGNRGFGVLIAVLSTVVFAAACAAARLLEQLAAHVPISFVFITSLDFWAPVVLFAIGSVVLVLVVNRAGWAAHVLGSIFVALVVYFGSGGAYLALHASHIPSNQIAQHFSADVFRVGAIVAAIIAREVALWMGFFVASRGRKVKARNVDARVLYDQEIAAKRAEYEQANARSAASAPVAEAQPVAEAPAVEQPVVEETAAP
jgi:hypothetical protein